MNTILKKAIEEATESAREYLSALEKLAEDPAIQELPEVRSTGLMRLASDHKLESDVDAMVRAADAVAGFVYGPGGPKSPRFMRLQQDALNLDKALMVIFQPINAERVRRLRLRSRQTVSTQGSNPGNTDVLARSEQRGLAA